MPGALLSTQHVRKSFGGLVAVDDVSLDVIEGSVTMMIGPNGSGKSTLINVISGFYKPDRGQVEYNGTDITGWPPHRIYSTGLARTFQVPAPFWKLTMLENLLVAARNNPGESFLRAPLRRSWRHREEELVDFAFRVLELLRLREVWRQEAGKLSGGQMKLLEIGRALMSGARMVLMDEPVSGVNPTLAHEIFNHILDLRRELGVTFLLVEHRLDVALQYVDYVYALTRGLISAHGPPDAVVNDERVIEAYLGG